jgi:hypothetical protein
MGESEVGGAPRHNLDHIFGYRLSEEVRTASAIIYKPFLPELSGVPRSP